MFLFIITSCDAVLPYRKFSKQTLARQVQCVEEKEEEEVSKHSFFLPHYPSCKHPRCKCPQSLINTSSLTSWRRGTPLSVLKDLNLRCVHWRTSASVYSMRAAFTTVSLSVSVGGSGIMLKLPISVCLILLLSASVYLFLAFVLIKMNSKFCVGWGKETQDWLCFLKKVLKQFGWNLIK